MLWSETCVRFTLDIVTEWGNCAKYEIIFQNMKSSMPNDKQRILGNKTTSLDFLQGVARSHIGLDCQKWTLMNKLKVKGNALKII